MINNNIDLLNKLSHRTVSYVNDDLQLPTEKKFSLKTVDSVEFSDISVTIALNGDMDGNITMSVSNDLALQMVKKFIFGTIPQDQLEELATENVAETLNITLGNILQDLKVMVNGGKIDISTPTIETNKKTVIKKDKSQIYTCNINLDNDTIQLCYFS